MRQLSMYLGLLLICLTGCKKNDEQKAADPIRKREIRGIYMEILNIGDGYQEKELYLGCDSHLKEKIKRVDTISNFAPVRMEIPCEVLNSINDSISMVDSIQGFTGRFPEVWYYRRYTEVDTGVVSTYKMFTFPNGKKHIWWMMDYILKHSPESFKSAKLGPYPFPPRQAPPDSAWLDTVKQGLF